MPRPSLDDILNEDDEFELLNVKLSTSSASTDLDRVRGKFEEINSFIDRYGNVPGEGEKPSVSERSLQISLNSISSNSEYAAELVSLDRHGILVDVAVAEAPKSLDDIFAEDDDILSTPSDVIFEYKHAKPQKARPDRVSERKHCEEFDIFKPLFDECAAQIKSGKRNTRPFAREQEISAGQFFILNGIMVYVAEVHDPHIRNGKKNARLRLIFGNGTEGNNLLRSLATELYKDPHGRRVIDNEAGPLFSDEPEEGDNQTGILYVVKSLSNDPQIKNLDGTLFKIGFTKSRIETRIQSAKDDPTFLMAPVQPVKTYSLYNIDRVKLENLIHKFFASACLDIEITDRFGKPVKPREWFLLSVDHIDEAVRRLIDGTITNYHFNAETGQIEQRK